ncbi:hypothetical protein [Dinghuibacter silviterrae]|uniref:Uncharacterized protein n=1 Tax=Dinghuibacter silviterrae TaxID=1539049 RepID=A0A4R8DRM2_9BACT|nr:hypothetical protein [Dinghuibacter silviterrae]TDX00486.1 hypothetical protein EDB95_1511 [Dinghuibacter silviterrae]
MKKILLIFLVLFSALYSFSQAPSVNNLVNTRLVAPPKQDTPTRVYLGLFRHYQILLDSARDQRRDSERVFLRHPENIPASLSTLLDNFTKTEKTFQDSVNWYKYAYDSIVYERGNFRFWFPTAVRALRPATFTNYASAQGDFNVINLVQFQAQSGIASLYAELLATNIGHLRISFGSLISANNDSSLQQQTLQSFLAGGGNAVLNVYYPIAYVRKNFFTFLWEYSPKIGGQIPGMGTYNNNVTGNGQLLASDIYVDFTSFDNTLGVYGFLRGSYTFGSSDFYNNLNVPHKIFGLLQLNAGLVLNSNIRISVSGPLASTSGNLLRFPWQIGVQLMPSSSKKSG